MRRRLLLSYLSITVFVLLVLEIPLGVAYTSSERRRLDSEVQHDALALSIRAEESLERVDRVALTKIADRYQSNYGGRVVIVARDGTLLADSSPPRKGPRNFGDRPEFRIALEKGKESSGTRRSETLNETLLYFAVPVVNGHDVIGAIRLTYPTSFVDARIRRSWLVLVGVALVVLGIVFAVSLRLARQVTKPLEDLEDAAARFGHGELDTRAPVPKGPPEIRGLAESFNQTASRLEELVTSQQAFVADASHQLRTPLAALRLRLENLEGELAPDPVAAEDVAGALAEVARLSRLVDGLLELARAERGVATAVDVELAELVGSRVDAWSALAAERGVELAPEVAEDIVVRSAPGRLDQALDNLLSNAIEVAPQGSAVRIEAARTGGRVALRVSDAGPGMTPAQRARAFDRFWRAPNAERDGGSGLGLAIVRKLVTADGGTVELDETPGGGLAVVMRLRPGSIPRP